MTEENKQYCFQFGFYYRLYPEGPVNYLYEGDIVQVHNSGLFLHFIQGQLWFYTGIRRAELEYFS